MRRFAFLLLVPVAAWAAADTQPSASGSLAGTIQAKSHVTRIAAVDRAFADVLKTSVLNPEDDFLYDGKIDGKGAFQIDHLLAGRSYDLILWTTAADGVVTRWEGVNMDYHRAITRSTDCTAEDRKAVEGLIVDPPQFYDKVRELRIAADHQHATVLVELMRTRDFHSDAGGEVIYRAELWYFENLFGGWAKDNNTEKVIARARGKPADLPKNWQFLPQLGNLPVLAAATAPSTATAPATQPVFTLPEGPDAKYGIAGGIK